MSYPRCLWTLIVEDEPDAEISYKNRFVQLRRELPVCEPIFAHSLAEAERILSGDNIFHLVIIDLRIPRKNGQPPCEDDLLGREVVRLCMARNHLPIPAALVVSAVLDQANDQLDLRERLESSFAYGGVLAKGEVLDSLRTALNKVLRYVDIGINLRDAAKEVFPSITPREDDLLRRTLMRRGRTGVDLRWWSASRYSSFRDMPGGWTKLLWGRVLNEDGMGSRPRFFKFFPESGCDAVFAAAQDAADHLPHVKVETMLHGGSRALLETEQVGRSDSLPISLRAWLATGPDHAWCERVAAEIFNQVSSLSLVRTNFSTPGDLIFRSHDVERLERMWHLHASAETVGRAIGAEEYVDLWKLIATSISLVHSAQETLLIEYRRPSHGDLHNENVLVDERGDAYIIDAAGMDDVALRDFAYLEIACVLHRGTADETQSLILQLMGLYSHLDVAPGDIDASATGALAIAWFVASLRKLVIGEDPNRARVYTLLLFDMALVQLGGLAFHPNRVTVPREVPALVAATHRLARQSWECLR